MCVSMHTQMYIYIERERDQFIYVSMIACVSK